MGQYYKGQKIGTCESMYYLRLEDAKKLALMGACDDDKISFKSMLTDNATMFRFPFPNEDAKAKAGLLLNIDNHSPSFSIPAGVLDDVGHSTICVSNNQEDGTHNINIFLPCPYSKEFREQGIKTSMDGAGEQFLLVKMQAMRGNEEKTIFSCARCSQLQRFSNDDIVKLKERAREYFKVYDCTDKNETYKGDKVKYDYAMQIIDRIR